MYQYNSENMKAMLLEVIRANVTPDAWKWFEEKGLTATEPTSFNAAFAMLPRKMGKSAVMADAETKQALDAARPGFSIEGWTVDRLARVYLVAFSDASDREDYFARIETLFLAAEMGELVALYSALPLLAYPELWVKRCSEGIRSNIGTVLEAIMYRNPYPAENLDEAAWNQLVMKAFFTDKQIGLIQGIDARANAELANILSDYVHERWAAHRTVNPQIWRFVGKFIDERRSSDVKKLLETGDSRERKAAVLAISQTDFAPLKSLIKDFPDLEQAIESKQLTWETLEQQA